MLRLLLLCLCLLGCNLATPSVPTATLAPTLAPTPAASTSQNGVWETVAPGLERRVDVPEGNGLGQIITLRIDPALYSFRAHYRPGEPLNLLQWRDELPDALALINANFFTPENTVLGLLVADGQVYGAPYTNRGGIFAIENGVPRIRSSITEPYAGEMLEQAVQAFPMLIEEGVPVYTDTTGDRATRRTVIAMDGQGRVLLIVTPLLGLRMADLAVFLAQTDYGIVDALNLDGGGSTMMLIRPLDFTLVSLDPVPAVLGVYPK
jgi:uncharacterized protein YigE (DUF2233 family)